MEARENGLSVGHRSAGRGVTQMLRVFEAQLLAREWDVSHFKSQKCLRSEANVS